MMRRLLASLVLLAVGTAVGVALGYAFREELAVAKRNTLGYSGPPVDTFRGGSVPIYPHQLQTDVPALLQLPNPAAAETRRQALRQFLWGDSALDLNLLPSNLHAVDTPASQGQHLARWTFTLEAGIDQLADVYAPPNPNGDAFVYIAGHDQDPDSFPEVTQALVQAGYIVVAMPMALAGRNRHPPVVHDPRLGYVRLLPQGEGGWSHDRVFLGPQPYRWFLDPVLAAVNQLKATGVRRIFLTGLSGGAWTATLYAALDERITGTYPVAGSLPLFLRNGTLGDFEQWDPALYRLANYPELYALGGWGAGRRHVQILNPHEHPCCFPGFGYRLYEDAVHQAVQRLGHGRFSVYADTSTRTHRISPVALAVMVEDAKRLH